MGNRHLNPPPEDSSHKDSFLGNGGLTAGAIASGGANPPRCWMLVDLPLGPAAFVRLYRDGLSTTGWTLWRTLSHRHQFPLFWERPDNTTASDRRCHVVRFCPTPLTVPTDVGPMTNTNSFTELLQHGPLTCTVRGLVPMEKFCWRTSARASRLWRLFVPRSSMYCSSHTDPLPRPTAINGR